MTFASTTGASRRKLSAAHGRCSSRRFCFRGGSTWSRKDCVWEVVPHEMEARDTAVQPGVVTRFDRLRRARLCRGRHVDEPAFAALARGVTVRVGPSAPDAGPVSPCNPRHEVRSFLEKLEAELR